MCILNSEYYDILSRMIPYNGLCIQSWMTKYIAFCNLENVFFSFIFLVE